MKGVFKDSKDWKITIAGDWRDKDGKPSKYTPKKAVKEVFISGGLGMYYFHKGDWDRSIHAYKQELKVIEVVELEEKRRLHKGLFYYQIGVAYKNDGNEKMADYWIGLAKEEDKLSYGDLASTFLASKL